MTLGEQLGRRSMQVRKVGKELVRYQQIKAALSVEDLDAQTMLDTLEGETELHEALLVVAESVVEDEAMIDAIGAQIRNMTERKSRIEAAAETKRNIILQAMDRAEIDSIRGPLATLTRSRTKPKVEIIDEAMVPARFWVQPDPRIDKKAVNDAVAAGEIVSGVRQGNGGISLTIRTK